MGEPGRLRYQRPVMARRRCVLGSSRRFTPITPSCAPRSIQARSLVKRQDPAGAHLWESMSTDVLRECTPCRRDEAEGGGCRRDATDGGRGGLVVVPLEMEAIDGARFLCSWSGIMSVNGPPGVAGDRDIRRDV